LLRYAALTLALGRLPAPGVKAFKLLPVLLFLRQHAEQIANDSSVSISRLLSQQTTRDSEIALPEEWLVARLRLGKCLVMLDGLDEVGDSARRSLVARWVAQQISRFSTCPFLLTSRPHGYQSNPIGGVTVLEVRTFNADQITRFVDNWYLYNEAEDQGRLDLEVRRIAKSRAEELLARLAASPALNELAVNPLLLTMIATVHLYRNSLPDLRVELYSEIASVYLGKLQEAKGLVMDLTPVQKQQVLESLAWTMMSRSHA
jgi:predicted NACHT family NTPase